MNERLPFHSKPTQKKEEEKEENSFPKSPLQLTTINPRGESVRIFSLFLFIFFWNGNLPFQMLL